MNNKEFDFDFDNFEIDDFGTNDPFQEPEQTKSDRSPVTDAAKGAFAGFKETSSDPSFYANVMRKALPEGYGAAFNVASDVTDKGIGLYNQVTEDLRPAIVDLKRIGRRAKNMVNGILPDGVSKKLDEILKEEERSSADLSKEQIREQSIAAELAPIFQAQAEEKKEEQTNELMHKVVDSKRHSTNVEISTGIRDELTKMNAYQDNVTMQWQRKTLELKLRHFFVAKDHYELFKSTQEETLGHFRNISKNTALPEAVKVKDSELALQLTKEKLIGKAQDKFAPMARDFLNKFSGTLGKRLGEKIGEFKDAISTASFAGDMLDGIDLEELGISKSELGGQMAGESLTRFLGEWLGKKAAPWLNKNEKVKTLSNKLLYGSENYHNIAREYLENKTFTSETGNMLQEAALDALRNRRESRVGYDQISNSMEHASLNNITLKSINEVIPGWLSKIYHAFTNQKDQTETFDHVTNSFMKTDELSERIKEEAVSESEIDRLREINSNLMKNLTDGSVDDISDKIEEMFLHFARNDVAFDPKKLMEGDYLQKSKLGMEDYDRFAEAVYNKMGLQIDGTLGKENIKGSGIQVEANRDLRRLRESMPNAYETANIYANTANREAVRRSGLTENIKGDDHVRDQYLFERYRQKSQGEKPYKPTPEPYEPTSEPTDTYSETVVEKPSPVMDDGSPPWNEPAVESPVVTQYENTEFINQISELVKSLQEKASQDLTIDYDRLYEIESTFSSQTQSLKQIEILNEIKEVLIEMPDYFPGTPGEDSSDGSFTGRVKNRYRRGKGFVKDKFNQVKDFGKKALGSPFGFAKRQFGKILNPFGLPGKAFNKLKDKFNDIKNIDLYTYDNPLKPAIDKVKLEAGEYYDVVTGKVITKISDIKNAVKHKDGSWAIRPDQISKGLFDEVGKKVSLKNLKTRVMDTIKKPLGLLNPKKLFGALDVVGKISNRLNRLKDVYVAGESEPRLRADGIKQGIYYNAKGKQVKTLKDLTTAIFEGKKCKIQTHELDKLVDVDGNKLRSFGTKLIDKTFGLVGKAFTKIKDLGKKGFGLLKGGSDKVSELMGGSLKWMADKVPGLPSFGGKGSVFGGSIQNKIYSLLLKYFAFKGLDVTEESENHKTGPGLFSGLGDKLKSTKDKVKGFFDTKEKREALKTKAKDKYDAFKDKAKDKKDQYSEKAKDKYDDVKAKAKDKYDNVKDKASDKLDEFSKSERGKNLNERKEKLKEKFQDKKESIKNRASDMKDSFSSKMSGYMDTLFGKFKKFRDKEASSKKTSFKDRLKNEVDGLKDRAGSFTNIMKERAEKRKAKKEEAKKDKGSKKDKKGGKGFMGTIISMLGGSLGFLGKIASGIVGLGGILSSILGVVGGAGLMGKALDFIGLGGPDKGKSWTRRLVGGAGRLAARAIPAAISAAPAIVSGGAAIASGVGTAIAATASVLFSPVVLTGLAVAGVAYLGYKWYSESMDVFTELRMAQYGVKDLEFSECERIGKFEEMLKPYIGINGEEASIQGKIPYEQIPEIFGFDIKDKRRVIDFNEWFTKRFKPVFLRQKYLLKQMGKTDDLMKLKDSIPDDQKVKFAQASIIREEPSPYNTTACPFGDEDVSMDHGMKVIDLKLQEIKDEYKVNKTNTPVGSVAAARRKASAMNGGTKEEPVVQQSTMDLTNSYTDAVKDKVSVSGGTVGSGGSTTDAINYVTGKASEKTDDDLPKGRRMYRSVDEMSEEDKKALDPNDVINASSAEEFRDKVAERRRNSDDPKVRKMQRNVDRMRRRNKEMKEAGIRTSDISKPNREKVNVSSTPSTVNTKQVEEKIASMGNIDVDSIYRPKRMTVGEIGMMVISVAKLAATEPEPILELAKHATGFNLNKRVGARAGLYLMDAALFRQLMDKHGPRYGVTKPDIKDPTDATIAAAEFLKVAIGKLRRGLGREPTAAENLSAMIYGVEATLSLILADDGVDVKTIIKPKTSDDTKRLDTVESKDEFFSGLSQRLNEVTATVIPMESRKRAKPKSSYVQQRTEDLMRSEKDNTEENVNRNNVVEKQTVERARIKAEQQRQRVKEQHMAESSQNSNRSIQELVKINSVLNDSNRLHKEHLNIMKQILQQAKTQPQVAPAQTQAAPEPTKPEEPVSTGKVATSENLDQSRINVRRSM